MDETGNYSSRRLAILRVLQGTDTHPTAEWVYKALKPRFKDLSPATVYRNLDILCRNGSIKSLGVVDGHERFDGDTSDHSHFVCSRCGKIVDVDKSFFGEDELNALSASIGERIETVSVSFSGVCRECREKEAGS